MRIYLLYLQGVRELNRLVHPKAIYAIKLGKSGVDRVVEAVWGFFSAYTGVHYRHASVTWRRAE